MLSLPLLVLTLCSTLVGSTCQNGASLIRRNKFSCGNKQYIVDYHNKIRNYVASGQIESQPKAANMVELRWSESLAKLAQKRADTCVFEHGDLELDGKRVGQNLAIVLSTADNLKLNITQMMEIWYNEVFEFGYKEGFEPNSGHYSQLIWGNTREVGCGYAYYKEDWYTMYLVCDYFPPGNWLGEKPYVYGKHNCKEYGLQNSRRYSKLCAIDNKEVRLCKEENKDLELHYMNNVTSAESNELNLDDKLGDVNENSTSSNESMSEEISILNNDDEVVTDDYEGIDETDGSSDFNLLDSSEKTTNGSREINNGTVATSCGKETMKLNSETIKDLEHIYLNLLSLKYAISGNGDSSGITVVDDSVNNSTINSTDETAYNSNEFEESENAHEIANNITLGIVNETLDIAVRLLETLITKKK